MIEFLLSHVDKLAVVEVVVETVRLASVSSWVPCSMTFAVFHHQDPDRRIADRGETVGYDEAGASLHELIKRFLNLQFGTGVDAGGCLIKNQHRRQAEHDAGDAEKLLLSLA